VAILTVRLTDEEERLLVRGAHSELEQWREDARRAREAAKEKAKDCTPTRDRDKYRDGPDYG
jgi:hypothetical protein